MAISNIVLPIASPISLQYSAWNEGIGGFFDLVVSSVKFAKALLRDFEIEMKRSPHLQKPPNSKKQKKKK